MSSQKTAFISYRRTNSAHARLIYEALKNDYDVFLDVESLDAGDFGEGIYRQIASRTHFIVILTPSSLERCKEPKDWMRQEIESAIASKRNIVPLMLDGFDYSSFQQYLTGKLSVLPKYNAIKIDWEYFDACISKLTKRFLQVDLDTIVHPLLPEDVAVAEQKEAAVNATLPPEISAVKAEEFFEHGFVKLQSYDLAGAIADFTKAIELNPKFDEAYYQRGRAYGNSQQMDKAIADWEHAIRLEPTDRRVNITRSCIFREKKNFKRAIEEADIGVSKNPDDSDAYFQRGNAKKHAQDFVGAIADYTKAIELTPDHAFVYYINRALTRTQSGDIEGVIADYSEVIRRDPNSARAFQAYNGRAFSLYKQGELEQSYEDSLSAYKLNPRSLNVLDTIGQITFARGAIDEAFRYFSLAYEIKPDFEYALAGLALCNHAMGRLDRAKDLWAELIVKDGNFENPLWAKEALHWHDNLIQEAQKLVALLTK